MTRHRTTSHSAKSRSLPGVSFIAVSPLVAPKRSFGTLPHRQEGLNAQANVGRQEVDRSHRTKMTNGTARVSGAWFEPKGTCNPSRGPLRQLGGPAPPVPWWQEGSVAYQDRRKSEVLKGPRRSCRTSGELAK